MALRFLDLFAGAGGLSEGFIQAGYTPVAHVEMDKAACYTLRTRAVFHELNKTTEGQQIYKDYLLGKISREKLYSTVPPRITDSVIEEVIGADTIDNIFAQIDKSQLEKVYISVMPCDIEKQYDKAREKFPNKQVVLFDAMTISYKLEEKEQ